VVEPPSRIIPTWNDDKVRSDGLKNTKPRNFAGERLRFRTFLEVLCQRDQIEHFLAAEVR